MAGSLVTVSYKKDDGTFYALKRDESNSRGEVWRANGQDKLPLFLPAATPFVGTLPPAGFKERFVNTYLSANPKIRRRFPIGNPAALAYVTQVGSYVWAPNLPGGQPERWIITNSVGEKNPPNLNFETTDSGQDDGTPQPGINV
jgi:hypothetical protein